MSKHILSRREHQRRVEELSKLTKFRSKFEVECLLREFKKLSIKGKIDRDIFRKFLHNMFQITDDHLLDRVFKAFDKNNDQKIDEEEWVKGLSIFLRGDKIDRTRFCFEVYDMNSDGFITKEDMIILLRNAFVMRSLQDEDPDETAKDLVELAMKLLDRDQDGRVSFTDFEEAVLDDTLLQQALGIILPDIDALIRPDLSSTKYFESLIREDDNPEEAAKYYSTKGFSNKRKEQQQH